MTDGAGSLLRDGVVLLGFGLVFVLLFRRLGLGATLGYLVAGAVVGPQVLGLIGDAEGQDRGCRAWHHAAAVHRRAGAESAATVADEERDFRPRAAPGRGLRDRDFGGPVPGGSFFLLGGAGAGAAAGVVLDRAGPADAAVGGAAAHAVWRTRLLDPAVPGPVDRAAHHDPDGDVAQSGGSERPAGLAAVHLHRACRRRVDRGRAVSAAAAVPDHRQSRRA